MCFPSYHMGHLQKYPMQKKYIQIMISDINKLSSSQHENLSCFWNKG